MTDAERSARRRERAKAELIALKAGGTSTAAKTDAVMSSTELALHRLAQQGAAALIPQVAERLAEIRSIFEQAHAVLASGRNPNKGQFMKDTRETCQWLTDALEQLSQCRATSKVQTVHQTKLARQPYSDQVWGDVAALCRDISSSHAWERIKAHDMPDLIKRGVAVLSKIPVT
ncbi:hypothetical protein [Brucella intermedia]|uniref:hypothetical protein n=1 Tax=Brucella intermedia TaxID=94625 RepID=UPI00124D55B9|nr:hypothetical protein [Brucella intermedia]KAB2715336.1 hypothetical protein F9K75_18740 [Brucella intermedia]